MQDRYEVERAWNIKRYQKKLKRKGRRGHFIFINTETVFFKMDDNNAQLCLTHARIAPVEKTRFQRQGSYKSIQEENTYYHKLVRTRLMIASQRQQSDPETQGMRLVLFSWHMIDSTGCGGNFF